jgi:hypothetical protein
MEQLNFLFEIESCSSTHNASDSSNQTHLIVFLAHRKENTLQNTENKGIIEVLTRFADPVISLFFLNFNVAIKKYVFFFRPRLEELCLGLQN